MPKISFEFVVQGPPYSANNDASKPKTDWKQAVGVAAYNQWIAERRSSDLLPVKAAMEAYITTYCRSKLYDVDNVLKWTLDGLSAKERPQSLNHHQRRINSTYQSIYEDDKLIYKLTSERIDLKSAELKSPSNLVTDAIAQFDEFLHIVLTWEGEKD